MPAGTRFSTPVTLMPTNSVTPASSSARENSSSMSAVGSPSTCPTATTSPGRIWRVMLIAQTSSARLTLPVGVIGSSAMNWTTRGFL